MNADQILDKIRPLVLVVDPSATVTSASGGYGGFLDYEFDEFIGKSVFDYVVPDEVEQLALYFAETLDVDFDVTMLPMPFNVTLIGADGCNHSVDVIPTRLRPEDGAEGWVVLVVPIALDTSVSRSLDAEMAGSSRAQVRQMLTDELRNDNHHYASRWFLVDLGESGAGPVSVATGRDENQDLAEAIAFEVEHQGWTPWASVRTARCVSFALDDAPEPLRRIALVAGWQRVLVAPVHVDGMIVAAYVMFGRVPRSLQLDRVNANVASRVTKLVDVTSLLIMRWRDQDRLVSAATRDPLTGLANRDSFADEVAKLGAAAESTLLYIDVDHFKDVNDRHGHNVGDQVLVEVARRIIAACRPTDVVARFGGDEFVVLLDGVGGEQAIAIGERIVTDMSVPVVLANDVLVDVTVSVGLAPVDGGIADVVNLADRAMLQAKKDGRSRIVAAPIPEL